MTGDGENTVGTTYVAARASSFLVRPTHVCVVPTQVSLVVNAEQTEVTDISVEVRGCGSVGLASGRDNIQCIHYGRPNQHPCSLCSLQCFVVG